MLLKQYIRELYLIYIVDRAIYAWSLFVQMSDQSEMQMTKPVQILTQFGSCLLSYVQNPEKLTLQ